MTSFTIGKTGTYANTEGTWDHRKTFASISAAARHLLRCGVGLSAGQSHDIRWWYITPIAPKGDPAHGSTWSRYYHGGWQNVVTEEQYNAIAALVQRYHAFLAACERERDWQVIPGSRVPWMDNSETHKERDKYGNEREVYDRYPSGDACF